MSVHPTAVIEAGARLGQGVTVGPLAVIGNDVTVGDGCWIGPHATILDHVRLGANCRVHSNAVLGDFPQDLKFRNVPSYVEIGPDSVIREGVTVHRGTHENSSTVVGRGCFLMANSHVAHNVRLGDFVIMANGALLAGDVQVGDRAFISGNAVVHQFTRIGALAMISGNAGVGKDVLPYCTVAGVRRNVVAGLNVVGMRRAGFSPADRIMVKRAFDIVFRSGLNIRQALERLRAECDSGPAAAWIPFIEQSRRGICTLRGDSDADGGE